MKKTGFVYKWTNNKNGKWYIGSHRGTTNDGYRHSSEIMKLAEAKYGLEYFTREILFEGEHEIDKIKTKEAEYLRKANAANNPMSYNLSNITGPNCWSDETNQKRSKAKLGSKNPNWKKPAWNRGIPRTEKIKKEHSERMKGRKQTKEHRQKNSLAQMGNTRGKACKGNTPWNKGLISVKAAWNKGKKTGPQKIVECIYCKKKGGVAPMKRWHNENCKEK